MRTLTALLLTCVALSAPAASATAATSLPLIGKIVLPAPGHVTVESFSVTQRLPLKGHAHVTSLLKPRFPGARALPPSVKILYLRRTFRTRKTLKTVVFFLIMNRATQRSARDSARLASWSGARAAQTEPFIPRHQPPKPDVTLLILELFAQGGDIFMSDHGQAPNYPTAFFDGALAENADLATPAETPFARAQTLTDLFGHGPLPEEAFSLPPGSQDPNIDTGHYDDGHSFGWKIKTPAQEQQVVVSVINSMLQGPDLSRVVPTLDYVSQIDWGDSGGSTNTTVGQPVVTGGP